MTLGAMSGFSLYGVFCRAQSKAGQSCYFLRVNQQGGGAGNSSCSIFSMDSSGNMTTLLHIASLTINTGDVWTLARVGSTLIIVQNGTILGSVVNTTWSSGQFSGLFMEPTSTTSDTTVTNFAIGSASVSDSISGNAGIGGATVSYSGPSSGNVTANGSGAYTISGLSSGTYTQTPSLGGYVFSPTNQNATIVASDITGVNFTASATLSISGNTDSSFTTVSWTGTASGSTTSDASGNYSIPGLANGTYTITPTKIATTFTPVSQNVTLSGSSQSGVNFSSNAPPASGGTGWLTVNAHDSMRHRS
jgi:hypothetical protein